MCYGSARKICIGQNSFPHKYMLLLVLSLSRIVTTMLSDAGPTGEQALFALGGSWTGGDWPNLFPAGWGWDWLGLVGAGCIPPPSCKELWSCYSSDTLLFRTSLEFTNSTPFPVLVSHTKRVRWTVLYSLKWVVRPRTNLVLWKWRIWTWCFSAVIPCLSWLFLCDEPPAF